MSAVAFTLVACAGVSELTVGSTPAPDSGTDGPPFLADPNTGTLLERLDAKCAAAAGQIDTYTSATELSARLAGRWYHCKSTDPSDWNLPRGTGLTFDFNLSGTWAFLDYADQTQAFTPSTDPDRSGGLYYYVFAGAPSEAGVEAGDGSAVPDASAFSSMFVAFNDATTRNGLFVELQSGNVENYQFQMLFEKNPRKLHLNELNGTPVLATFVPID